MFFSCLFWNCKVIVSVEKWLLFFTCQRQKNCPFEFRSHIISSLVLVLCVKHQTIELTERKKLLWQQQQKWSMQWLWMIQRSKHTQRTSAKYGPRMCVEYAIKHLSHRFFNTSRRKTTEAQTVAATNYLVMNFSITLKCSRCDDKSM